MISETQVTSGSKVQVEPPSFENQGGRPDNPQPAGELD